MRLKGVGFAFRLFRVVFLYNRLILRDFIFIPLTLVPRVVFLCNRLILKDFLFTPLIDSSGLYIFRNLALEALAFLLLLRRPVLVYKISGHAMVSRVIRERCG